MRLHLATLATYDQRLAIAAVAEGFALAPC
jgi:hypothetical protein